MPLVEGDEVVEALPADAAHQSFAEGVRLGRTDGRLQGAYTEISQRAVHGGGEDAVPIVDQKAIGMVEREKFAELLGGPFGGMVVRDIEVQNSPGAGLHRHKQVQNPKGRRDRSEKIASHNGLCVILHKCAPPLAGGSARPIPVQVLPYGSRRDSDAQLNFQFICDALLAPSGSVLKVQF